ncbi:RagB/SusD family nutrient uptake outer membrane protein [Flavobacterium sp. ASW18X]|uniref:RagB/SusD family nutrient uptake outer membrane protein n=1 Tax=Flavobacterium sp. ASW18X TaxID=2572595 RepID=UPI0010AEA454|nr:RagB/SusD family nutrient uptake outer membrane protein [Flavobacterium sp. ASW18X]TKD63411.1 RagB/SusD family nutrient uptake outer membrane protein [Flavobacterium sp. ASW18X]
MKTKKLYILILIIFTCIGCEDFLEEDPRAIIAPESFFASDNDARQAVQGTYAILKNNSIYGQVGLDHFYDNGADIIEPNRPANFVQPIGDYSLDEALADVSVQKMSVSDTWKDLYRVVFNSNFIIDRVTDNESITEDVRTEVIAECRFLRALAYWHITNLWGNAPYYTEALTLDEVRVLGRTDENIIIDGIIEDLQFAQAILPSAYADDQRGRASRWAAAIIEAKIYMKQQDWQAGLTKCLEIINQSPHMLLPTYEEVFDPLNEYNAEIIWSLDFARDITGQFDPAFPGAAFAGNSNWRPSMFNPRLRDEPANSDERGALGDALRARGEAFNGTGLQVAAKDFAEKFPLNDLRRPLNIVNNYLGFELNFPYMAKFWNLDLATSPRFNHEDNRMVFRLADVYLMAAECENELNGPANAFQYLNPIRQRAYETEEEWDLTGLDQQGFREAIYDERKWELAGEAHRRYDLIRWGILFDVMENIEYRFWNPAQNIKPWHVLLPIPLQELEQNPALLESDPTNNGYR